jgi:hypothetical protein
MTVNMNNNSIFVGRGGGASWCNHTDYDYTTLASKPKTINPSKYIELCKRTKKPHYFYANNMWLRVYFDGIEMAVLDKV